jgi:hypothetical protein
MNRSFTGVALAVVAGAACLALAWRPPRARGESPPPGGSGEHASRAAPLPGTPGQEIEVPPPPFSEGIFPCTRCHEKGAEFDTDRRELGDPHDQIKFEHDAEHRWCLDCHNGTDRDHLRLASGDLIDFTESYKLCGQCHGDKYRDWRAGVHGRRTGQWDGKKTYLLCVNCHNPHSPRFRGVKPLPPPRRPEVIK